MEDDASGGAWAPRRSYVKDGVPVVGENPLTGCAGQSESTRATADVENTWRATGSRTPAEHPDLNGRVAA